MNQAGMETSELQFCQEPKNSFGVRFPRDFGTERNKGRWYLTTLASTCVLRLSLSTWSISETPWG